MARDPVLRVPRPAADGLPRPSLASPGARPRFWSEADCRDIAARLARYASGGGHTEVQLVSRWQGSVRWARNEIVVNAEDRDDRVLVWRVLRGARNAELLLNDVSDTALLAAVHRAEQLAQLGQEHVSADLNSRAGSPFRYRDEAHVTPDLFFEGTYQLEADRRAEVARQLMQGARAAGMRSAGYLEVSATSFAFLTSWGYAQYCAYTWAQCTTTVRDPNGVGSGWAGVDWPDWTKVETDKLAAMALDKCLTSRHPVAIEPERYTTILEPQAVGDIVGTCWDSLWQTQWRSESGPDRPEPTGFPRFGERIIDKRLTLRSDPMDPALGFPPILRPMVTLKVWKGETYHPVTWIERGILKELWYGRDYGIVQLGRDTGLPVQGAIRMDVEGAFSSIEEMVATTQRGLLVTRCDRLEEEMGGFLSYTGITRDGVWLIEQGKLSTAVKNMRFRASLFEMLNQVEQVGVPQRCFHLGYNAIDEWRFNPQPVVAPALKIKDFAFTAVSEAI